MKTLCQHKHVYKCVLASAVFVSLTLPLAAQASSALAVDKGCYNCHGNYQRGEAPSFERLAKRMTKYKGDDAGLDSKVQRYQKGEPFERIEAHERISAESAKILLRWLSEGGK